MSALEYVAAARRHWRAFVVLPLAAAMATLAVLGAMPRTYVASTTLYVLARTDEDQGGTSTQNNLAASQMLTNDVVAIVKSDRVRSDVEAALGIADGYEPEVESSSTTRVVKVTVSGPDPDLAAAAANAYAGDATAVSRSLTGTDAVSTLDSASVPTEPRGPGLAACLAAAMAGGLLVAATWALARDSVDDRMRGAEDVEGALGVPVMATYGREGDAW